jgi:hypothetical protein
VLARLEIRYQAYSWSNEVARCIGRKPTHVTASMADILDERKELQP